MNNTINQKSMETNFSQEPSTPIMEIPQTIEPVIDIAPVQEIPQKEFEPITNTESLTVESFELPKIVEQAPTVNVTNSNTVEAQTNIAPIIIEPEISKPTIEPAVVPTPSVQPETIIPKFCPNCGNGKENKNYCSNCGFKLI